MTLGLEAVVVDDFAGSDKEIFGFTGGAAGDVGRFDRVYRSFGWLTCSIQGFERGLYTREKLALKGSVQNKETKMKLTVQAMTTQD